MSNELTYAFKTLRASRWLALTAIATLALGVGTAAAVFSVAHAILWRPLPYADAERLVMVCDDRPARSLSDLPFSAGTYHDVRNGATATLEDVAAVSTTRGILPGPDGKITQIGIGNVTPNFFSLLGVGAEVGRMFGDADAAPPGGGLPAGVLLTWNHWQERYGGNRAIVGQRLFPNGPEIIGIVARDFELLLPPRLSLGPTPDIWFPVRLPYEPNRDILNAGRVIARLRPTAPLSAAQQNADVIAARLRGEFPTLKAADFRLRLEPLRAYVAAEARPIILLVVAAGLILLAIACANVTNLLLVRAHDRHRDVAVRTALGARAGRIYGGVVLEAILLGAAGAVLGVGLAVILIRSIVAAAPVTMPRSASVHLDFTLVGFAALAAMLAALSVSILPAWTARRWMDQGAEILRTSGTGSPRRSDAGRRAVIVLAIAVCFVLLVAASSTVQTFLALKRVDLGYAPDQLLTFSVIGPPPPRPEDRLAFMTALRQKLGTIPGVTSVTGATPFPLAEPAKITRWGTDEAATDASKFRSADFQVVLPGYFETMHVPLLAGRTFTDTDNVRQSGIIIDNLLAAKAFPNASAVGKRILVRMRRAQGGPVSCPDCEWAEVIGVVGHERLTTPSDVGREQIYYTDGYMGHGYVQRWAIRTSSSPSGYSTSVRDVVTSFSPILSPGDVRPMSALVDRAARPTTFALLLIGVLGVMSVVLVAIGLYGVMATAVTQRTHELGIQIALGQDPTRAARAVVVDALKLIAGGAVLGTLAAVAAAPLVRTMFTGFEHSGPLIYATVALVFLAIGSLASWLPARRAAALDPTIALRN